MDLNSPEAQHIMVAVDVFNALKKHGAKPDDVLTVAAMLVRILFDHSSASREETTNLLLEKLAEYQAIPLTREEAKPDDAS